MIQLTDAAKRFGPRLLFERVNWFIGPKERIGLVGANGTGKTTLLKLLCGAETLDAGSLSRARGTSTGYLPQEGLAFSGGTVFEECMSVFADLRALEAELEDLTRRMAELDPDGEEYQRVAQRFHDVETEFRGRDGYSIEARTAIVLSGLGFGKRDWNRRIEEFSGGWQMRIALVKLLLAKPNLLLLDEPTNHLDLEARNWLEEYLAVYPYSYVLVSHDRYFLDVIVRRVVEIWNGGLHFYTGNYSKYLVQKNERRAQLKAARRNQQARIEQFEAFINRFRYTATKARQVQSRIKELERMERISIPPEGKTIQFSFPQPKPSGRIVAEFKDVSKRYGDKLVFAGASFLIERGDRIALVGVNGAGKSTLMKLLAGVEPLTTGEYRLGHNAEPNYFAQDQYRELDAAATLLDDLAACAPGWTLTQLRTLLGCFLFSDDDVYKPIGVLSGGERNRYALARLLVAPSNFLLLDEPTNHLDMRAKGILLNALAGYTGTVVFVSHDRYFIDDLANRIFEVADGGIEVFSGNYEDFLRWKERAGRGNTATPEPESSAAATTGGIQPARNPKRINPIRLRRMRERAAAIEDEIAQREAAIAECARGLTIFESAEQTRRQTALLAQYRRELDALMAEWEELTTTISEPPG